MTCSIIFNLGEVMDYITVDLSEEQVRTIVEALRANNSPDAESIIIALGYYNMEEE